MILHALDGRRADARVDQDGHREVLRDEQVGRRQRLMVEVAEPVVGAVREQQLVCLSDDAVEPPATEDELQRIAGRGDRGHCPHCPDRHSGRITRPGRE